MARYEDFRAELDKLSDERYEHRRKIEELEEQNRRLEMRIRDLEGELKPLVEMIDKRVRFLEKR